MKATTQLVLIAMVFCLALSPAPIRAEDRGFDADTVMKLTPVDYGIEVDAIGAGFKKQQGRTTFLGVKVEADLANGSILILEAKTDKGWVDLGAFRVLYGGGSMQISSMNNPPMELRTIETIAVTYRGKMLLVGTFPSR